MHILKQGLLLLWLAGVAYSSLGQSYTITPNDTIEITGMREDLQSLMISQQNISSDTIRLKWQKVSVSIPANWDATICDNSVCFGSLIDSGMMVPAAPGGTGFLLLHVTAHVNYGTAIVRYVVSDIATPMQRDTLTFIVHIVNTTAISERSATPAISIYPNPVSGHIQINSDIETGFAFHITDLSGRDIQAGNTATGSVSVDTRDLAAGIYLLTLTDKSKIICTQKLIKQ